MKILSRLLAESVIQIRAGSAHGLKGKLVAGLLADIAAVAKEAGLAAGEIWIEASGKIRFSREIPEALHQRFRNVIALY